MAEHATRAAPFLSPSVPWETLHDHSWKRAKENDRNILHWPFLSEVYTYAMAYVEWYSNRKYTFQSLDFELNLAEKQLVRLSLLLPIENAQYQLLERNTGHQH